MYVIYALGDPRDNKVRYVGMTSNIRSRFIEHIKCLGNNKLKNIWIDELISLGMLPFCQTLETVYTINEARDCEAYWIKHYERLKMLLTNLEGVGPETVAKQIAWQESLIIKKEELTVTQGEEEFLEPDNPGFKYSLKTTQAEMFVLAYKITGNIDKSLEQIGVHTGYRAHARKIIADRGLRK